LGRYTLERRLGAGGMAEVFKARQTGAEGFSRLVALKRIAPGLSEDAEFARLFIAEARIAASLQHPNIIAVHDFDRDESGCLFLAMELVDGADLRRLLSLARERREAVPVEVAAFIAAEALRALEYAHEFAEGGKALGIVHRDVSPHNVLISRAGAVKLADFGIAKATAATGAAPSTTIKGKVSYMAPEQARGDVVDGRADLFAVGVMLYELLAGERPFDGASEAEILGKVLTGRRVHLGELAPATPAALVLLVEKLLAPRPEDRFADAASARIALTAWSGYPSDGASALSRWVERHLAGVALDAPLPPGPSPGGIGPRTPPPAATRTGFSPSRRTVGVLAVLAALSVAAAVTVSVVPVGRQRPAVAPSRPSAGRGPTPAAPAAPAVAPGTTMQPPQPEPNASAPVRATSPSRRADAAPLTPDAPVAAAAADGGLEDGPDARPAPRPGKKGAGWLVDPGLRSPDLVVP
jgi:serine/threonine-protein kinase